MDIRLLPFLVALFIGQVKAQNPEIVDEIWPEVQQLGRTARLNCTVINQGTSVVQWLYEKSNELISRDEDIEIQINPVEGGLYKYEVQKRVSGDRVTYMLIIRRLKVTDAGYYKCTTQLVAVTHDKWSTKLGLLTVQVPPSILVGGTTAVIQIKEGQNATLQCNAFGIPHPNITWAKSNGGFLVGGVAQSRNDSLQLTKVTVKDMGVYRCVADNNIRPPAEHLAEVLVFHAPTTRVVQNSVGQAQNRRFDAMLECVVKGHPEPTVFFERRLKEGRVVITDDEKFDVNKLTTDNQNLYAEEQWYTVKVKNVQANDYSEYYCIARNKYGSHESTITLFETMECQGPNCPSLPSSRAPLLRVSAPAFLVTLLLLVRHLLHLRMH